MSRKSTPKRTRPKPKAVLRLPDLDHAKAAVLNSLTSPDAQRGYRHTIDEFVDWYCSEPRLLSTELWCCAIGRISNPRQLAPGTVNLTSRCGAPTRIRGRRLRPPQRRFGDWHSPC